MQREGSLRQCGMEMINVSGSKKGMEQEREKTVRVMYVYMCVVYIFCFL